MATRRDELSAHTFARKRTLAAFLQPESRVSDEEAPRPVRAMMPSAVMGIVLVAGFVAWGAIAPSAPPGWDDVGKHIIVDSDSTTRYVVLQKNKNSKKQLHPVMNFASAKLVLDKGKGEVIEVSGKDIDESPIARGATIGIPYAPDRLPGKADAEAPKEWAVCEKPGGREEPQQGVFVLGGRDKDKLKNKYRLGDGEALYVEDSKTGDRYVVDGTGTKLLLDGPRGRTPEARIERDLLTKQVLRNPEDPQLVSSQWLNSLNKGDDITFPTLAGGSGAQGRAPQFNGVKELPPEAQRIGTVLQASSGGTRYYYVVLKDRVQRSSPLFAKLVMARLEQEKPIGVSPLELAKARASDDAETGGNGWPEDVLKPVNRDANGIDSASRTVSCSVYTGKFSANKKPKLAAWAGPKYPANIVDGAASAYVSSGSGLLYQELSGRGGGGGRFLLTDSGLRYAVPKGGDGQQGGNEDSPTARLGYEKAKVPRVPESWSSLIPKGPTLDTDSASQEQGL